MKKIKKKVVAKYQLKRTKGITLIVLVITIIVLLILAGVSIGLVFSSNGLFSKASDSTRRYNQQKAEEALRIVLSDAQLMKYGKEGLTDEKLDEKINEIGQVDDTDNSLVIVDKYIFQIDRNVPKIIKYVGESDGITIKYKIIGNDNWVKPEKANIMVNVTIQDNGGPLKGNTIRITKDGTDITSTITSVETGIFTLTTNTSTTYAISVENSKGETSEPRIIKINAKIDGTAPTIEKVDVIPHGMTIKISAIGHDKNASNQEESGLKQFEYTISSTEDSSLAGIPEDKRTGVFIQGQTVEIETTPTGNREETTYTISITAIDNCDNRSTVPKIENVTVKEIIPVTGIGINKETVYLEKEKTEKLVATIEPSNATNKDVEWISSNSELIEVSNDGTVKAKNPGKAIITVKSKENENISREITVKVGEKIDLAEVPLVQSGDGSASLNINPATLNCSGKSVIGTAYWDLPEKVSDVYCEWSWSSTIWRDNAQFNRIQIGIDSREDTSETLDNNSLFYNVTGPRANSSYSHSGSGVVSTTAGKLNKLFISAQCSAYGGPSIFYSTKVSVSVTNVIYFYD